MKEGSSCFSFGGVKSWVAFSCKAPSYNNVSVPFRAEQVSYWFSPSAAPRHGFHWETSLHTVAFKGLLRFASSLSLTGSWNFTSSS